MKQNRSILGLWEVPNKNAYIFFWEIYGSKFMTICIKYGMMCNFSTRAYKIIGGAIYSSYSIFSNDVKNLGKNNYDLMQKIKHNDSIIMFDKELYLDMNIETSYLIRILKVDKWLWLKIFNEVEKSFSSVVRNPIYEDYNYLEMEKAKKAWNESLIDCCARSGMPALEKLL